MGDILGMVREKGVQVRVVTGGTAARKAVKDCRPEVILSVACERDTASGISDVYPTPVVGVLNQRPNGPCLDTVIDMDLFRKKLESLIWQN